MKIKLYLLLVCLILCAGIRAQLIIDAEYFINTDPGTGLASPISITPGLSINESIQIPVGSIGEGLHILGIRVLDDQGLWSLFERKSFIVEYLNATDLVEAEFFIDADPGIGNATPISITSGTNVNQNLSIPIPNLSEGMHLLAIRVKNAAGKWSLFERKNFIVQYLNATDLVSAEFFIDADPGIGNASPINVTAGASVQQNLTLAIPNLSEGMHLLAIRVKNAAGKWSLFERKNFIVQPLVYDDIVAAEYFIDADPGAGNAIPVEITNSTSIDEDLLLMIPNATPVGDHNLALRILDSRGKWSLYEHRLFKVCPFMNTDPTFVDVSCAYSRDGSAAVNPSGGMSPYTFNWSSGQTTSSISGLSSGIYHVTITGADDCETIEHITIGVVADLENPVITCPTNISVSTEDGECSKAVNFNANASDNCEGNEINYISIENSDFESGNTGFSTEYSFAPTNTTEGEYNVLTNPQSWNGGFNACVDHTSGSGKMLVLNGHPIAGKKIWCQQISTVIGNSYYFEFWSTSFLPGNASNLEVTVNGTSIGDFVEDDLCAWEKSSFSFIAVNSVSEICIRELTGTVYPNDFAIDDITLYEMVPNFVQITYSKASGSIFNTGTTTVTAIATDAAGNESECTFTVMVSDDENPVIVCPANISVSTNVSECSKAVSYSASASDNCDGVSVSYSPISGSTFNLGTTTVTVMATDGNRNESVCSFTVSVSDNENPMVTCPSNISVSADLGVCSKSVSYSVDASDNCEGVELNYSHASGSSFSVGITTVTATATDANGNESECSFTVTVSDDENPVISCPSNISVPADPGVCTKSVSYSANSSDNCGSTTIIFTPASGSSFNVGTNTVTSTATDGSSNESECTFTVTVSDDEDPVITCPSNISVLTDADECSKSVNYSASSSDNCAGTTISYTPASGSTFNVGTTTVTATVIDAAGNEVECTFTITVSDDEDPVITCPSNITVSAELGECSKAVSYSASASDNCEGVALSYTPASGSTFNVGTTTVAAIATDANDNESECTFTVTVSDDEDPVITCPEPIVETAEEGSCTKNVSYTASGSDNCEMASITYSPASGSIFNIGVTTVTVVATDIHGNENSCTFTVTINALTEICDNEIDDDCDGLVDEGCGGTDTDGDGVEDENDNCPTTANPNQNDNDCDSVGDVCDVCPGGDDTIDNNNDGQPDCHVYPGFSNLPSSWKCGNNNNKVYVCHNDNNPNTICVAQAAVQAHLDHGDYIGPCGNANCGGGALLTLNTDKIISNSNFETTRHTASQSNNLENELWVVPNPVYNSMKIVFQSVENNGTIKIFNSLAEEIWTYQIQNGLKEIEIKASELDKWKTSGMYFIKFEMGTHVIQRKFIVLK